MGKTGVYERATEFKRRDGGGRATGSSLWMIKDDDRQLRTMLALDRCTSLWGKLPINRVYKQVWRVLTVRGTIKTPGWYSQRLMSQFSKFLAILREYYLLQSVKENSFNALPHFSFTVRRCINFFIFPINLVLLMSARRASYVNSVSSRWAIGNWVFGFCLFRISFWLFLGVSTFTLLYCFSFN